MPSVASGQSAWDPYEQALVVTNLWARSAEEEHHLGIPVVGRERPAVSETIGVTEAPSL
jgi:hypothetical protein